MSNAVLEGRGLTKTFRGGFGGRPDRALTNVDIQLLRGETLGLMGPSGCGKSTLARLLLRLIPPDSGQVFFDGQDVTHLRGRELRFLRRRVQLISQRPESFFDPRLPLGKSLREPLRIFGLPEEPGRVEALLEQVKLTGEAPILVLDEPTSMLDISVQAQILSILRDLRERYTLSCLLITHDREVADYMCERVVELSSPARGS